MGSTSCSGWIEDSLYYTSLEWGFQVVAAERILGELSLVLAMKRFLLLMSIAHGHHNPAGNNASGRVADDIRRTSGMLQF